MTIAIVAGWRRLPTTAEYWPLLDAQREKYRITAIWHGACEDGADVVAEFWAKARGIHVERFPAPWELFKAAKIQAKAAGGRRITDMLAGRRGYVLVPTAEGQKHPSVETTEQVEGRPELMIAMPGYAGTRRTIREAERAGLGVERIQYEPWVANKWHYRDKDGRWSLPPGAVDIQRGTAVGNPFIVGDPINVAVAELGSDMVAQVLGRRPQPDDTITSDTCLDLYRRWLMDKIRQSDRGVLSMLRRRIGPTSVLMCTCKRADGSGLCHGDVVVRAWRWIHGRRQPDAPRAVDADGGCSPDAPGQQEHGTPAS